LKSPTYVKNVPRVLHKLLILKTMKGIHTGEKPFMCEVLKFDRCNLKYLNTFVLNPIM